MAELEFLCGSQADEEEDEEREEEEEEELKRLSYDNDQQQQQPFNPRAWFDILKHRLSSSTTAKRNRDSATAAADGSRQLWTNEIIKLAGARIIQSRSSMQGIDVPSMLNNPFHIFPPASDDGGLTPEEAKNVELMEYLLACAEKVGKRSFDRAAGLLNICDRLASQTGNPVQRVGYYFCNALRQRIEIEQTGGRGIIGGGGYKKPFDSDTAVTLPDKNATEFRNRVPFYNASQLAAVQIMVENVAGEKRIHLIELRTGCGLPAIALMQALSVRADPIELLRITALAHDAAEEQFMEGSGRRLADFARGMGLPFSFNVVRFCTFPSGAHKDQLDLEPNEAAVVLSEFALGPMIGRPKLLEAMMKLIRAVRPRVMVVIETEANHNAPDFGHRFVEALFTVGGYFDSLATCMEGNEEARAAVESWYLNDRIRNVLVAEGEERIIRDVKIRVWRKYFARFGMLEIPVRGLALQHANLVIRRSPYAASCLVALDYKSLMIGWKDVPLLFVSAWKFMKAIPH
ncbi:unnamed protein product [Linum trigynum]